MEQKEEVMYEKKNKQYKVCQDDILQRLRKFSISEDIQEDKQFKDSVVRSLSLRTRYFQRDVFSFCYGCKQIGHTQRHCMDHIQKCIYCLSYDHLSKNCTQVCCYKCHLKGHRKFECKTKHLVKFNGLQSITDHRDLICLNCKQIGHSNCLFELVNNKIYS